MFDSHKPLYKKEKKKKKTLKLESLVYLHHTKALIPGYNFNEFYLSNITLIRFFFLSLVLQ